MGQLARSRGRREEQDASFGSRSRSRSRNWDRARRPIVIQEKELGRRQ